MVSTTTNWGRDSTVWQNNPLVNNKDKNNEIFNFNHLDPDDHSLHGARYDGYGAVYTWGLNPNTGEPGWEKTGQLPPGFDPKDKNLGDKVQWSSEPQVAIENHYNLDYDDRNPLVNGKGNSLIDTFDKLDPGDGDKKAMRYDGNGAVYRWNGDSWEMAGIIPKEFLHSKNGGPDPSKVQWGVDI
ncbi:hypothetical protein EGT07_10505 [Herbaspirillum sp. HC18]|nr:hypothetical protein EGT07_10505 [Herbaspirillum sp. HC18]